MVQLRLTSKRRATQFHNVKPVANIDLPTEFFIPQASPQLKISRRRNDILAAIEAVLDGQTLILGPQTAQFESEFASFLGAGHCVGVSSGTDAVVLALQALNIGKDDHVLVPAMSAPATAAEVVRVGAKIRFVDIEPNTRGIDPELIASRVTKNTKAIIVVHLHGIPASISQIMDVARGLGLPVVEDCAQAHGIVVDGRHAGTFGELGAFSYYPTKNLGCLGDGGSVVTQSSNLAARVRMLRNYGTDAQGHCVEPGLNHRLDELQAAVLRVLLPDLDADNRLRREFAEYYDNLFRELGDDIGLPPSVTGAVYHQYAVTFEQRDTIARHLRERGVGTMVHYPIPLHRHKAFADAAISDMDEQFPISENLAKSVLSLPIQPELRAYQKQIGDALRASFAAAR
jgi:dTDP-4-amino-4,6-dideoxygalactose transaminase